VIVHVHEMSKHPDAVYIGRECSGRGRGPSFTRSQWANPWNWKTLPGGRAEAVALFRRWLAGDLEAAAMLPPGRWPRPTVEDIRRELAGRVLACWCGPGDPCHGHVLAEIANGDPSSAAKQIAVVHPPAFEVVVGDCVNVLNAMPAGTADLVVADPPYNIGIDYGDGRGADELPSYRYAGMVREWMLAIERVLSPAGTLWVVCDSAYGAAFDRAIVEAGLTIRDRGVWHESFGVWRRGLFGKCWRPWFYAVKDRRRFTFNEAAFMVRSRRQEIGDRRANPAGKVRSNVWTFSRVAGTFRERVKPPAGEKPPTQLPLAMVRMVVDGFTNPGDLIVDPFTGTGTTGVAAVQTGRRFVGIELRETWAAVARQRIEAATADVTERRDPHD